MTLDALKQHAGSYGAELFILQPGQKLPAFMKGEKFEDTWLCVLPETERHLIYAAVPHFSRVCVLRKEGK